MTKATRISPEDARRAVADDDALLVCAYDDAEKCEELKLDGSIAFPELQRRKGALPKDQELVFYCA